MFERSQKTNEIYIWKPCSNGNESSECVPNDLWPTTTPSAKHNGLLGPTSPAGHIYEPVRRTRSTMKNSYPMWLFHSLARHIFHKETKNKFRRWKFISVFQFYILFQSLDVCDDFSSLPWHTHTHTYSPCVCSIHPVGCSREIPTIFFSFVLRSYARTASYHEA